MSDLSKPLAGLSPSQLELLRLRLAKADKKGAERASIPLRAHTRIDNTAPLSFAQQRIWFLNQFTPDTSAYNIIRGIRLSGRLSIPAFEQTINEIVRRHEALRTTFALKDNQPTQLIAPRLTISVPLVSLTDLPAAQRESSLNQLAVKESRRAFVLSRGPLLRITLVRLAETEHALLVTMHHIIGDYWSLGIFIRELGALLEAYLDGKQSPLTELSIQYSDYSVWQREWMQGSLLQSQRSYWQEQLAGYLPLLDLPGQRSVTDLRGKTSTLLLSESLSASLKSLSQQEGCTLTMTLLAAFKLLLHRLTRQSDIILGLTIANRNQPEVEQLIGFFVNTLALRTDLSEARDFRELLRRVRENCLGAYAHQDFPFEKLTEELQPERKPQRNPFFDILFNSLNASIGGAHLPGLQVRDLERDDPESKFILTLNVEEVAGQIGFRAVYQQAALPTASVTCLLNQYQYLLEQIVAEPGASLCAYSLITSHDRAKLPDQRLTLPEPQFNAAHELFASWAANSPAQIAIRQGERECSYAELANLVADIASELYAKQLAPGDVWAVTGTRSVGLIASLLAVLSAGGVILPLDPNLPPQRKQLALSEARAKGILLVGEATEEEWVSRSILKIEVDPQTKPVIGAPRLESVRLPADAPAYIFMTSGTTGLPKAVLGVHKGLSHFLDWERQEFSVGPDDRCAQLTNLSFDVVLRDIFLPLTSGATLCLPQAADDVLSWLEREQITLLHAVPTLAEAWLRAATRRVSLSALRWVLFAGEPLTETLINRWRETFPESGEIGNLYGPTETTLAKCFYRVPEEVPSGIQPVGWPLPQTQALVVSANGQLCGIGEPGEIVIRTPFRSLGYMNAPEEMRKRFIKNPSTEDERDLLYLTGDQGRYRLDGALEILGRLDEQVKIRGVRVEPAEVTALLAQHPAVASCIVVGSQDDNGEKILVAYIVRAANEGATVNELRAYLSRQLPMVMVPSVFMFIERLPLTRNGKVDRQALPAPRRTDFYTSQSFLAPRTPVEGELTKIWSEVLGLDRIGAEDNFFELGGHSLMATQVIARAQELFRIDLPLRNLFENPTVAGLAANIETMRQSKPAPLPPPIRPVPLHYEAAQSREQLLAHVGQLTDDEVDALLGSMLTENESLK